MYLLKIEQPFAGGLHTPIEDIFLEDIDLTKDLLKVNATWKSVGSKIEDAGTILKLSNRPFAKASLQIVVVVGLYSMWLLQTLSKRQTAMESMLV